MSKRINLNSSWQFTKKACKFEDLKKQKFDKVNIPHTWNAKDGQDGGDDYHRGLCWYTKTFNFTPKKDKEIYIEFEAVNSVADVYLNGKHLGQHRGGYSAFRFDITDAVKDGQNTLVVGADNSHIEDVYPMFADFTFYGGIYRDVNLIITDSVHFELMDYASCGVYVSQKNVTDKKAELEVRALISNSEKKEGITLNINLKDENGNSVSSKSQKVNGKEKSEIVESLTVNDPVLWNGTENPYLYTLEAELVSQGETIDMLSIPTGLRYFKFDGDKGFMLNGKRCRLNGVSRHQDREHVGNALTRKHQIEDMALIKEVGANSIRLAHYQHNQYFYDLCDKEGMVVWAEIPYISRTSEVEDYAKNAVSQMKELVKQSYNHPSIVMWGVQNEIGMFPDEKPLTEIVNTMDEVVKEMDITRVTTQAQVMMIKENDPANWETDIVAFNQYHGWYVGETEGYDKFINDFRKANPHKCMGYSEYGAEGILKWHTDEPKVKDYTEEYHAKFHEEVMAIFNKYDFIWGTYVWNMFDFGSDMRDEGGIKGRNNKGLVTFDRKVKKDAFYFYKSLWSEKPVIHICSKRFIKRHTDIIKIKVYSNQGDVTLSNNGTQIKTLKSKSNIYVFEVELIKGKNKVSVSASGMTDTAVFKKVNKPEQKYIIPASEKEKGISMDFLTDGGEENVKNWFNDLMETGEKAPELDIKEGYFSVKDKLKDIMANSEGEAFMRSNLKPLVEHSMFKMIKGGSLKDLQKFQPDVLTDALLYKINEGLNKIKK